MIYEPGQQCTGLRDKNKKPIYEGDIVRYSEYDNDVDCRAEWEYAEVVWGGDYDYPAFDLMRTATSGTYFDMCGNAKGHIKCADCTDCVMKQIVEKCKDIKKDHYWGMREIRFSQEILELLDIEECK